MVLFDPNDIDQIDDFDVDSPLHDSQLHLSRESNAIDSDEDGWSDAVEQDNGTDPFDPLSHPGVDGTIPDDLHMSDDLKGIDIDSDGFPDKLEQSFGTDPLNAASHPDVVMPHHFDSNGDAFDIPDNLYGTFDIKR